MSSQYFKLFSTCIPVKGQSESLICDIEYGQIFPIPNLLFEILKSNKTKNIEQLKDAYSGKLDKGIDAYFNLFEEKNLGFYTDTPEEFPDLNLKWQSPYKIRNAVIEIENLENYSISNTLTQLNDLGCEGIQIRILTTIDLDALLAEFECVVGSRIKYIEIFLPFNADTPFERLIKWRNFDPRITKIIQYNALEEKVIEYKENYYKDVFFLTKKSLSSTSKEQYSLDRFAFNIDTFAEAQKHNIGLNRKISIDSFGNIKNYLTHKSTFGNINDTLISNVINLTEFKKDWNTNNTKIEKCNQCQFRFSCVSNVEIIKKNRKHYKLEECNFNPLTNQWN